MTLNHHFRSQVHELLSRWVTRTGMSWKALSSRKWGQLLEQEDSRNDGAEADDLSPHLHGFCPSWLSEKIATQAASALGFASKNRA
jgi:hypothetical protein